MNEKVITANRLIDQAPVNVYHRVMLMIFLFLIVVDGYDLMIYGSTVALLMPEFGISAAAGGAIGSCGMAGAAAGALVIGPVADRFGRKSAIIGSIVVFSTAMLLLGLVSHDPVSFAVLRFIAGVALGGMLPNVTALASEYMPQSNRAGSVAIIMSGMVLGGAAGGFIGMVLFPRMGWRIGYIIGAVPVLLLPVVAAVIPESPVCLVRRGCTEKLRRTLKRICPDEDVDGPIVYESGSGAKKVPLQESMQGPRKKTTISFWILYFMGFYIVYGIGTWLPSLMMKQGFSMTNGLKMVMLLNLGAFIVTIALGSRGNRLPTRNLIIGCYSLCFISIIGIALSSNMFAMSLFVIMAGIGSGVGQNFAHSYVSAYYPPRVRSTGMGFCFGIGRIGSILGPYIGGVLLALNLPVKVNYMVIAVPAALAVAAVAAGRRSYGRGYECK